MDKRRASLLAGHAAIVLLIALIVGFPFATATTAGGDVRAWRMAHLEALLNGLLMLGVAAAAPLLALGSRAQGVLFWTMLLTGYGNALASWLAAASGERGLAAGGSLANNLVFVGFMIAVVTVAVGLLVTAIGAFRGARPEPNVVPTRREES
jgi:hypothetical protein